MAQIIADIDKNSREIIRIDISEFKGKELINIRIWYHDMDGTVKPTQKGVALDINQYQELKKAVEKIGEYITDKESGSIPAGE